MKLYNFPKSSASYRVRIACGLKQLNVEEVLVNFRDKAQRSEAFLKVNASGLVPAFKTDEITLSQSLAIIRYLDHIVPDPLLVPKDPVEEARVMEMALIIACDVHPINNLRVLNYLKEKFEADEGAINAWYAEWILLGFAGLEDQINKARAGASGTPKYCFGEGLTLADICLVPQVFNARRYNVPLEAFPSILAIDAHLTSLPEFIQAAP